MINNLTITEAENIYSAGLGKRFTLGEYVEKWRTFINKVRDGYGLTIYDYTNDVSIRDTIDIFIQSLPDHLKSTLPNDLYELDESYKSLTVGSPKPLMNIHNREIKWWWYRFPTNPEGELLEDLKEL
jgi:hypothetical protein